MNIKSLLLGSAAALVAVSGARAADAIIAEPEPVEYVRVCDVYGAGFFYIPGTETCLKIFGEVRYQIGTANNDDGYHGFEDDTWNKLSRGRFGFDARSETEWGTLQGYIRINADRLATGASSVTTNHAWLSLGGLRMGWSDSAWVSAPNQGAAAGGSHSDSGLSYAYHQTHFIQYNFTGGNGLFATVSLEDDNMAGDNYVPDVVGVVGVNQGWGAAWLKGGYDEEIDGDLIDDDDDGFGLMAGLHLNVPNMAGSSFRLLGFYADSDNVYAAGNGEYGQGAEWSVLASYYHQFNPSFGASVGVQYFSDFYVDGTDESTGDDGWQAELNLVWTPVENFVVRTEIVYSDLEIFPDESVSGFLRFSRFF
jgi:hypothetical protein